MITPYTLEPIVYAHELAYAKGRSLANYRERMYRKTWAHIQRWLTLWSALASITAAALPVHAFV